MGRRRNLLVAIRKKLARSSCRAIDVAAADVDDSAGQEVEARDFPDDRRTLIAKEHLHGEAEPRRGGGVDVDASADRVLTPEDMAAIQIQASYRGHLARRAFRALRALVKLQALVRGVCVRRQVRAAMQCMHALVRLQVRVRTRQLLGRTSSRDEQQMTHIQ